jgi:hypothetical protein
MCTTFNFDHAAMFARVAIIRDEREDSVCAFEK